jgi:hypothetical protein
MQSGTTIDIIGRCGLVGLVLLAVIALGSTAWESPVNLDTGLVSNAVPVTCTGPGNTNCCSSNAICFYMTPDGSDANDGTSEADGVATLSRVQQLIQEYGPINTHIEVRIKKGIYRQAAAVQWTYYTPGYSVSFMPSDYKWGVWGSFEARPVFSGEASDDSNWFEFVVGRGEWTRLAFYYLEVRNYARGGILLSGGSSNPPKWNGYNSVYGMYFSHLGMKWAHGPDGYAGVFLVNSRNNFIENNHFVHLENGVGTEAGSIHAVYMKNWASNNVIRGNRMSYVAGDPVRVRNESNDNDIYDNVLDLLVRMASTVTFTRM